MSQSLDPPQRNLGIYLDSLASVNTTLNEENQENTTHIRRTPFEVGRGGRYQRTGRNARVTHFRVDRHLWTAFQVKSLHKLLDGLRLQRDREILTKLGEVFEVPPARGLFPFCLVFKNVPQDDPSKDLVVTFVTCARWAFSVGRKLMFDRDLDTLTNPEEFSGKPTDFEMYCAWRCSSTYCDYQFYFPQVLVSRALATAVASMIKDGHVDFCGHSDQEEREAVDKLRKHIDLSAYTDGVRKLFSDVFDNGEPLGQPLVPVPEYFLVSWTGVDQTRFPLPDDMPNLLDSEDRSFALWDKFSVRPRDLRVREHINAWLPFQRDLGQFCYYSKLSIRILGSRLVHFSAKNELLNIHSGLLPRREAPPAAAQPMEEEEPSSRIRATLDPSDKNTIYSVRQEIASHLKLHPGDWVTACQLLNMVMAKYPTEGNGSGDFHVLGKIGYLRTVDEFQSGEDLDTKQLSAISNRRTKSTILKTYPYPAVKKMLSGLKSYQKVSRKRKKRKSKRKVGRPPRNPTINFEEEEEEEDSTEDEDDDEPLDEKGRLKEGWKEFDIFDLWERWEHASQVYHLKHMPYNTDDPKQKELLHSSLEQDGLHLNTFAGWVCPISDLQRCYEKCLVNPQLKKRLEAMEHWFLHHYGTGEQQNMEFLMKLILSMLYFPYQKTEVSVVFTGPQGIGKSMILRWISFLMGRYALSIPNADALFGQFQVADIKTTVFLGVQELHLELRDKQLNEKRSKLKDLIDGVNLLVNVKYGTLTDIINTLNLWMTTNGNLVFAMLEDLHATSNNEGRRWFIIHMVGAFFLDHMLPESQKSQSETINKQRAAKLAQWFIEGIEENNYFLWRAFVGKWAKQYPPESLKDWIPRLNVPVNTAKDKEIWQAWLLSNKKDEQHKWYNFLKKGKHIDRELALRFAHENRQMDLTVEVEDPHHPLGVRTVDLRENDPSVWDADWLMYWNMDVYYLVHFAMIGKAKTRDSTAADLGAGSLLGRMVPLELKTKEKPPIDALTLAQRLSTFLGPGITEKATRASNQHWFRIGPREECLRRFARALCLPEDYCLGSVENLRTEDPLPELTKEQMALCLDEMLQKLRPPEAMVIDSQEEELEGHNRLMQSLSRREEKQADSDQDDNLLLVD